MEQAKEIRPKVHWSAEDRLWFVEAPKGYRIRPFTEMDPYLFKPQVCFAVLVDPET